MMREFRRWAATLPVRRQGGVAIGVACCVLVASCGDAGTGGGAAASGAGPPRVVASTNVYGGIARTIGGDAVRVSSIIDKPSSEPHDYEATPQDAAAVANADVVIANGGGYDPFLSKLVRADDAADRTAVTVSSLADVATPSGEEFNEHLWYDIPTMRTLAKRLAQEFAQRASEHAEEFRDRAEEFIDRTKELTDQLAEIKTAHADQRVAATEPLPGYLLDAAGLVNATPGEFMEATEEGHDPPAAAVADTRTLVQPGSQQVQALIVNTQAPTSSTDQLNATATQAGVPVVTMTELRPPGSDYVSWMDQQITALHTALTRDS